MGRLKATVTLLLAFSCLAGVLSAPRGAFALQQELGDVLRVEEHGFSIRPPEGWHRKVVVQPVVMRIEAPVEGDNPPRVVIIHVASPGPERLGSWVDRLREHLEEKFPGHQTLQEQDFKAGPYDAHRRKLVWKGQVMVKTVIHRSHMDYLLVDAFYEQKDEETHGAAAERCMRTLTILPRVLTAEEKKGIDSFLKVMEGRSALPESIRGEDWQIVWMGRKKAGHQMYSLTRSGEEYSYSVEVHLDFDEEGGKKTTRASGTFSPDASRQTVFYEEEIVDSKKVKHQFRSRMTLENGKVRVERELQGEKEQRVLEVGRGVALREVADFLRALLSGQEPGMYTLRTIGPFDDEPNIELCEVQPPQEARWKNKKREIRIVQSKVDGRIISYWYESDLSPLRVVSGRSILQIEAAEKEEALGGK